MPLPAAFGALAAHRKVLLLGGAGVAAALGVAHAHKLNAGASSGSTAAPGDPAANGATIAGYSPADTSGTDVYNALQPQIEQTQNMISDLLAKIAAINKPAAAKPKPKPKPKKKPAKKKPRPRVLTTPRRVAAPAPHKVQQDTAYVTRRSDTLGSIAARNGTNVAALAAANRGLNLAQPINSGVRLVVPNPAVRR